MAGSAPMAEMRFPPSWTISASTASTHRVHLGLAGRDEDGDALRNEGQIHIFVGNELCPGKAFDSERQPGPSAPTRAFSTSSKSNEVGYLAPEQFLRIEDDVLPCDRHGDYSWFRGAARLRGARSVITILRWPSR